MLGSFGMHCRPVCVTAERFQDVDQAFQGGYTDKTHKRQDMRHRCRSQRQVVYHSVCERRVGAGELGASTYKHPGTVSCSRCMLWARQAVKGRGSEVGEQFTPSEHAIE